MPPLGRTSWWVGALGECLGVVVLTTGLAAADRVAIRPEGGVGLMTLVGDVVDYNADVLTIRVSGGGPPRMIPAAEVAAVETYRSPDHQRGLAHYRQGELEAAVAAFQRALETEGREWIRRELYAELVRCHSRQGDLGLATTRFVQLVESDPHHRHWGVAPLLWTPEPLPPLLQATARRWLVSPNAAVRLVGASLLLGETTSRVAAVAELKKLEHAPDRYVGGLAQALLWSTNLQTNLTSPEQLRRWERDVERMPPAIRGGPWYLLGRIRLHRNEQDEAAAAFLRVFLVHHDDDLLAARSGLEAALALRRLNRDDEARTLLWELVERYPWSTPAQEARQQLAALSPAAPIPPP